MFVVAFLLDKVLELVEDAAPTSLCEPCARAKKLCYGCQYEFVFVEICQVLPQLAIVAEGTNAPMEVADPALCFLLSFPLAFIRIHRTPILLHIKSRADVPTVPFADQPAKHLNAATKR